MAASILQTNLRAASVQENSGFVRREQENSWKTWLVNIRFCKD
jgi:hypothetical protein